MICRLRLRENILNDEWKKWVIYTIWDAGRWMDTPTWRFWTCAPTTMAGSLCDYGCSIPVCLFVSSYIWPEHYKHKVINKSRSKKQLQWIRSKWKQGHFHWRDKKCCLPWISPWNKKKCCIVFLLFLLRLLIGILSLHCFLRLSSWINNSQSAVDAELWICDTIKGSQTEGLVRTPWVNTSHCL